MTHRSISLWCSVAALAACLALSPAAHAQTRGPGSGHSKFRFTPVKAKFGGSRTSLSGSFQLGAGLKVGSVRSTNTNVKQLTIPPTRFAKPVAFRGVTTTNTMSRANASFVRARQALQIAKVTKLRRENANRNTTR